MDEFYFSSCHFNSSSKSVLKNTTELIGEKAAGLVNHIENETLPFIVIKSNLYDKWCSNHHQAEMILETLLLQVITLFSSLNITNYIIRSSAKIESYRERGNYFSSDGNIRNDQLFDTIKDIWRKNNFLCNEIVDNTFAIIIQQYIEPKLSGHISNERRVSRNANNWIIEYYKKDGIYQNSKRFILKTQKNNIDISQCNNANELHKCLKLIPTNFIQKGGRLENRMHIEWVWDGLKLWLVQCDLEDVLEEGTEPGSEWIKTTITSQRSDFRILKRLSLNNDCKWSKTQCVKTFIDLNLPFGEIYILDDPQILEDLSKEIISMDLVYDLKWLLEYPIVIRTDIKANQEYERVLLPRTDSVFTLLETTEILIKQAKYFISEGIGQNSFCFLIHRFILSKSCALAFSKPRIPKSRIDSTWGIVDGLYYHPHDSFEVSNVDKTVKKQIRCKNEYLDVKADGVWFSKKGGTKYDWKESLTKKQLTEIANYTTKIANKLDRAVTVMYFVDVDKNTGYKSILPWFYTTDEITEQNEKFSDSIFSNNYILIETEEDLERLENNSFSCNKKYTIKLRPNAGIIRDKKIVERIADFAKKMNIPIQLEGSILAHPYYILRKKGVKVKCVNYFSPQYNARNFYKLVRDKIPVNIELKGETATTVKIAPKQLLYYLKEKAIEEALEFYWEKEDDAIIEELADLFEIIRSSCNAFNISLTEIEEIADKKAQSKGGFDSGILLINTTESSLINVVNYESDSLFSEDSLVRKKTKSFREKKTNIYFDSANLNIPYINNESKTIKIPGELANSQSIKISYLNKSIELKFIKEKKAEDLLQLTIKFPDDK